MEHRIFSGELHLRYRHRLWLILIGRTRVALHGLRTAYRSLSAIPTPKVIVVYSHIEVLMVNLVRWLLRRQNVRTVLLGFILTARRGRMHNYLREMYFRYVLSRVDLVVVHSRAEAERYSGMFNKCRARFVYIPWATHVDGLEELRKAGRQGLSEEQPYVLSAGRSGRDYRTLFQAFQTGNTKVRIVCDSTAAVAGCTRSPNVEVLDRCYDDEYLKQVWNAYCVVIPLAVDDISAGQMVLLQAMAMGKPVVITRTTTTAEYVTDNQDALCIPPNDPAALRKAVDRLFADRELCRQIGLNAEATFLNRFSIPTFAASLMQQIRTLDPNVGATNEGAG